MNEPLVLQTRLSNTYAISRLKNVDVEFVGRFLNKSYKTYLVRLLDLLADDLININGGDYETSIHFALDDRSLDIGFEKVIHLSLKKVVAQLKISLIIFRCMNTRMIKIFINLLMLKSGIHLKKLPKAGYTKRTSQTYPESKIFINT